MAREVMPHTLTVNSSVLREKRVGVEKTSTSGGRAYRSHPMPRAATAKAAEAAHAAVRKRLREAVLVGATGCTSRAPTVIEGATFAFPMIDCVEPTPGIVNARESCVSAETSFVGGRG